MVETLWGFIVENKVYALLTLNGPMSSHLEDYVKYLWDRQGKRLGRGMTNMYRSTLFMAGVLGTGTPMHFDWTSALNWCLRMVDANVEREALPEGMPRGTLAWWLFLHADIFLNQELNGQFRAWCKEEGIPCDFMSQPRLGEDARPFISYEQVMSHIHTG